MEQQLIDANYAIALIKDMRDFARADVLRDAIEKIKAAMTVDAVPVCRCRECKHNIGEKVWLDGDVTIDCANGMGYPPPNWYCADGERRTE